MHDLSRLSDRTHLEPEEVDPRGDALAARIATTPGYLTPPRFQPPFYQLRHAPALDIEDRETNFLLLQTSNGEPNSCLSIHGIRPDLRELRFGRQAIRTLRG